MFISDYFSICDKQNCWKRGLVWSHKHILTLTATTKIFIHIKNNFTEILFKNIRLFLDKKWIQGVDVIWWLYQTLQKNKMRKVQSGLS